MTERTALFIEDGNALLPANKNAVAVCAILSSRRLSRGMMAQVRSLGYTPRLTSGEEIGKVDYRI